MNLNVGLIYFTKWNIPCSIGQMGICLALLCNNEASIKALTSRDRVGGGVRCQRGPPPFPDTTVINLRRDFRRRKLSWHDKHAR